MLICFFLVFMAGASAGSMIHCAVIRGLDGGSFMRGRSRCFSCGKRLQPQDLVPLFSWIVLRGRCRYCGEKIGADLFLAEAAGGTAALTAFLRCGSLPALLFCWYAGIVLLFLSLEDNYTMQIPDICHVLLAGGWMVLELSEGRSVFFLMRRWLSAVLLFAVFVMLSRAAEKVFGKAMIGDGDLKLLAVFMLWFGGRIFLLECMLGSAFGVVICALTGKRMIPFGPALSAAAYFLLLFGSQLFPVLF